MPTVVVETRHTAKRIHTIPHPLCRVIVSCRTIVPKTTLVSGSNVAFAFDNDVAAQRYIALTLNSVSLNISSTGLSTSQGMVKVDSRYTAKATLELQQKKNGVWQPIKSWSDSGISWKIEKIGI